jgi:antitoxin (DNA-binding transcriptional repressor) of toxin-antitoxin stability system
MRTITLTVDEAARDLPAVIRRMFNRGEHAVLTDAGRPVAEMVPLASAGGARTGAELAAIWEHRSRLETEEAESYATDVEDGRGTLNRPPVPPRWE